MGPMQTLPKKIKKYTVIDWTTGLRILVDDAPEDIRQKAIEWEKRFYSLTSRRCISNLQIDEDSIPFYYQDLIDSKKWVGPNGEEQ